jgi:hypothetical protein
MKAIVFMLAALLTWANAQNTDTGWYTKDPDATIFEISNAAELRGLAELVNGAAPVRFAGKTIKLTKDIDLGGEDFIPIGNNSGHILNSSANSFLGIFDGQEHTISGLSVNLATSSTQYAYGGLFGYVGATGISINEDIYAQIKNVNVIVSKIYVTGSSYAYAGGLAGTYKSTQPILNCNVQADSIIAHNASDTYAGGLVGYLYGASIKNSSVRGNIISKAFSSNAYAGGLAGYASDKDGDYKIEFNNNRTSGSVSAPDGNNSYAGGLIGHLSNGIKATYTTTFTDCHASENVSSLGSTANAGGLVGRVERAIIIANSYASGDVMAAKGREGGWNYYCGGLVGHFVRSGSINNPFIIRNSYASGNISISNAKNGSDDSFYHGGLIGYIAGATQLEITNSYTSGTIAIDKTETATGTYYSGGFIGYTSSGEKMDISNSYVGGNVLSLTDGPATVYAGGIFGRHYVGEQQNFASIYYNSDITSDVSGTICRSYNDCYSADIPGISGKTKEELKKTATFINWDFENIWGIVEDYSMPFFKNMNYVSSSSGALASSSSSNALASSSSSSISGSSSSSHYETPIRLHQIVASNNILQIRNGINLHVTGNAVVEIYNLNGKLIGKQNFTEGAYNVSLNYLPKGLYIVKAMFGREREMLKLPVN